MAGGAHIGNQLGAGDHVRARATAVTGFFLGPPPPPLLPPPPPPQPPPPWAASSSCAPPRGRGRALTERRGAAPWARTAGALAFCAAAALYVYRREWTARFVPAGDVQAKCAAATACDCTGSCSCSAAAAAATGGIQLGRP